VVTGTVESNEIEVRWAHAFTSRPRGAVDGSYRSEVRSVDDELRLEHPPGLFLSVLLHGLRIGADLAVLAAKGNRVGRVRREGDPKADPGGTRIHTQSTVALVPLGHSGAHGSL
jgi:hypothetical protein